MIPFWTWHYCRLSVCHHPLPSICRRHCHWWHLHLFLLHLTPTVSYLPSEEIFSSLLWLMPTMMSWSNGKYQQRQEREHWDKNVSFGSFAKCHPSRVVSTSSTWTILSEQFSDVCCLLTFECAEELVTELPHNLPYPSGCVGFLDISEAKPKRKNDIKIQNATLTHFIRCFSGS